MEREGRVLYDGGHLGHGGSHSVLSAEWPSRWES